MGSTEPVVRTERLTKRFGDVTALDGLDVELREGEVLGYLGPNGAGKSVTIRLLLGLLRPTSGRALLFGLDSGRDAVAIHRRLAYVPGETSLWPWMTGAETLAYLGNLHGNADVAYRDELVDRFGLDVDKKVRALSKGNRQKLALIAAFMTRPELLILDEPTSGLDPLMEVVFRKCAQEAKANGQSILLSSHILSEVESLCDRVAILRAGRLVDVGTLDELRHLSTLSIEITFAGEVPDLSGVAGVSHVEVSGNTVSLQMLGPLDALFGALAGHHVNNLVSREPSLEELFLAHYRDVIEPSQAPGRAASG
jgi:ABC-2 type transport system ATP-binding protein